MAVLRDKFSKVFADIVGGVVDLKVMLRSPVHPLNAFSPIDVTELPIVTEVRPVQFAKASYPIDVTELGMVISVSPVQPLYLQVFYYQLFTY